MPTARAVSHRLTHAGLVLAPQRAGRGWARALAALVLAAAAGGAGYWAGRQQPAAAERLAGVLREEQALKQALEQSRLGLRVSDARGQELERQVDALNQRLRECQDELSFFRKARDGKR